MEGEEMRVMIPLANGFEDIEALSVLDVLRRAKINVDTIGVIGSVIQSRSGVKVIVDKTLNQISPSDYDAIILPGGSLGCQNLERSSKIMEILKTFNSQNKLIGAICKAPEILAKAGFLDKKKATIYPGLERTLAYPRNGSVVVDGNIITSQGPGTAIDFALKIVEKLTNMAEAQRLRKELVVHV
jgi:4-methyl-5(b-hydroxyethyl)-thiazole monophosphate biosynthesis